MTSVNNKAHKLQRLGIVILHGGEPLSYGEPNMPWPEDLLKDRGATIFADTEEAEKHLQASLQKQQDEGADWMNRNRHFTFFLAYKVVEDE